MSLKDLLVVDTKPHGILLSLEGLQKCGKSEFGLSMPDPLYILNLNLSLVGVIEKHVKNGRIFYDKKVQIPFTKELPGQVGFVSGQPFALLAGEAAIVWKDCVMSLREALADKDIKSVFVDTGSELWDLLRIARLGKLAQVMPIQYTAVNAEFRQLIQLLLCSGKNVLLSHKVKSVWTNDVKTDTFERAGFGDIGFDVQAELKAERDMKAKGDDQFSLTFLDCRANKDLKGTTLRGADCNFLKVVTSIYPDTTEADWI